jgi:hypothetical protein
MDDVLNVQLADPEETETLPEDPQDVIVVVPYLNATVPVASDGKDADS